MIRTLAIAATVFAAVQAPAFAGDVVVEFDSARLEDPAYLEAVKSDISAAAAKACKAEYAGSPLFASRMRNCIEQASADAEAQIDQKLQTAQAKPTQVAAK